ncbi:hypothetical protein FKM82_005640 [Ascaphus truei]
MGCNATADVRDKIGKLAPPNEMDTLFDTQLKAPRLIYMKDASISSENLPVGALSSLMSFFPRNVTLCRKLHTFVSMYGECFENSQYMVMQNEPLRIRRFSQLMDTKRLKVIMKAGLAAYICPVCAISILTENSGMALATQKPGKTTIFIPSPVVTSAGVTEVSPEFLAALPPAIQEEVLAQQRAEQQRRELAQSATSDTPMDPVTFIQTLPSDLRRSVLEDMEDSVLAVMPPDIAAEAQALRREQEARQRQLMHERLFGHSSTSALSAIQVTARLSGNRGVQYTRLAVQRGGTFQMGGSSTHTRPAGSNVDSLLRLRGRLLLDHEALSCLLVLLFVDEPKLNTSRLHRVLRNLCYHAQTRNWVICSLLSILQRSSETELCIESPKQPTGGPDKRGGTKACASSHDSRPLELLHKMESKNSNQLSWLSVSMDAALGCRTNIFQIQRSLGRKHTEKHAACGSTVHIHPQAAPVVCRHVLDTLMAVIPRNN